MRSPKLFFCYDASGKNVSLLKRANGRTIKVSPLDYLKKAGFAMSIDNLNFFH